MCVDVNLQLPVKYTIVHTRNVIASGLSLSNRNLAIIMMFDNLLSPRDYVLTPVFSFLPVPLTISLSPILFLSSKYVYALSPHTSNYPRFRVDEEAEAAIQAA